jgi:hypothetical protein
MRSSAAAARRLASSVASACFTGERLESKSVAIGPSRRTVPSGMLFDSTAFRSTLAMAS